MQPWDKKEKDATFLVLDLYDSDDFDYYLSNNLMTFGDISRLQRQFVFSSLNLLFRYQKFIQVCIIKQLKVKIKKIKGED